jgi:hypothetical protein
VHLAQSGAFFFAFIGNLRFIRLTFQDLFEYPNSSGMSFTYQKDQIFGKKGN